MKWEEKVNANAFAFAAQPEGAVNPHNSPAGLNFLWRPPRAGSNPGWVLTT